MEAAKRQANIRRAHAAEEAAAAAMKDDQARVNVSEETRRRWELDNNVSVTSDAYLSPDVAHMDKMRRERPWKTNPNYFTEAKVSALAALKMFIHARRGSPDPQGGRPNWFEVMGLMMGHFKDNVIYITDSFGLPVDASEVECSMTEASQVYMISHMDYYRRVGKPDKGCLGWYHSHPGYTCFLSGIDVATQRGNQMVSDPYLAIVVDPVRTIATGRMDLKAFRTYPESYVESQQKAAAASGSSARGGAQLDVPEDKIKDFGVHAHHYYEIPITIVRTRTDEIQLHALLSQYWSATFTTNSLLANQEFVMSRMSQLVSKLTGAGLKQSERVRDYGGEPPQKDQSLLYACPTDPYKAPWSGTHIRNPDRLLAQAITQERGASVAARAQEEASVAAESTYRLTALTTELLLGGAQLELKEQVFNPATTATKDGVTRIKK